MLKTTVKPWFKDKLSQIPNIQAALIVAPMRGLAAVAENSLVYLKARLQRLAHGADSLERSSRRSLLIFAVVGFNGECDLGADFMKDI